VLTPEDQPPYENHHGGGLWLKDAQGWFLVRNLVGLEWSSQQQPPPRNELRAAGAASRADIS
jgi:Family of unknown function (DUF6424)